MTTSRTRAALVDRLAPYQTLVEIGIGSRTDVAAALATRASVTAVDVRTHPVPAAVSFVQDDVTDPQLSVYNGANALYALNCPPELQRPLQSLATEIDADCLFTTLGADPTLVGVEPETIPGDTLYRIPTNGGPHCDR
ncbi:UPF0146 family protein [Halocatena halophila]|uniref:UPF0146 family protein n=1 Tax=Halocatena halophila TaxID=2814576 RepID=UPI002ED5B8A6